MNRGFTLTTPMFISASITEDIDLTSLATMKDGNPCVGNGIIACALNEFGRATKNYLYVDDAEDPESGDEVEAWVDSDDWMAIQPGEVVFGAGQGFWIQTNDSGFSLQSSGRISLGDVLVTLNRGFSLSGNCLPTSLDLTDIIGTRNIEPPFTPYIGNGLILCILNESGRATKNYLYVDDAEDPESGDEVEAWVDSDDWMAIQPGDVVFDAGQGFWIQTNDSGFNIYIPAFEF